MAFDFKKEYREFYMPSGSPEIVDLPEAKYLAVRGKGNPNEEDGEYKRAVGMLYTLSYTLKMSYKGGRDIKGFYEYVVPPLEGFWWQEGVSGADYSRKADFNWISVIRVPEFISEDDVDWAKDEALRKKKADCGIAELMKITEGLCVQAMHTGTFDSEPATVALMDEYILKNGYINDFTQGRLHHEIYLSDARRVSPDKLKTVIRHPIKRA